jgi:hypothetical protein
MVGLGDCPGGGNGSQAQGVSGDGSVVVGFCDTGVPGDEAFIWDAENGMRVLSDVLEQDFGLDLTGWTLNAALETSDDGRVIVGFGVNPSGNTEAWRAVLAPVVPPVCSDGVDNDGDGLADGGDAGCASEADVSEEFDCDDTLDNDGDGFVDTADAGCTGSSGSAEFAQFAGSTDGSENDPTVACDDGLDDDDDGFTDYKADALQRDPGCASVTDTSEDDPALPCDDGLDNDSDGANDFPSDLGCKSPTWPLENPQCEDGIDNNGDTLIDWNGGPAGGNSQPICVGRPWRNNESSARGGCGLGVELVLLLIPLARLRARRCNG